MYKRQMYTSGYQRSFHMDIPWHWHDEFELVFVTVSYTHLDVYKRQVYTTLDRWPVNVLDGWENKFAAIDFRGMYRAGFSASEAAELAKSITTFVTYSHRLSKA